MKTTRPGVRPSLGQVTLPATNISSSSLAVITSFEPEHVVLEVEASAPALLVLAEAWYPGWRATVDGDPAAVYPANGWMRAVPVPVGRHRVADVGAPTDEHRMPVPCDRYLCTRNKTQVMFSCLLMAFSQAFDRVMVSQCQDIDSRFDGTRNQVRR